MHEMSLCEGMLQIIKQQAKQHGFSKVKEVFVEVGDLATVEIESLKFCFEVVVKNTLAENSKLVVQTLPGKGWCMQCSQPVTVKTKFDKCPLCESYQIQLIQGDELRIKEMEVE